VISFGTYLGGAKDNFSIFWIHRFTGQDLDPDVQLDKISQMIAQLRCRVIGVDYGGGFWQNDRMTKRFGPQRLVKFQYNPKQKKKVYWEEHLMRYMVHRTEVMSDIFAAFKDRKVDFPSWEDFIPFNPLLFPRFNDHPATSRHHHAYEAEGSKLRRSRGASSCGAFVVPQDGGRSAVGGLVEGDLGLDRREVGLDDLGLASAPELADAIPDARHSAGRDAQLANHPRHGLAEVLDVLLLPRGSQVGDLVADRELEPPHRTVHGTLAAELRQLLPLRFQLLLLLVLPLLQLFQFVHRFDSLLRRLINRLVRNQFTAETCRHCFRDRLTGLRLLCHPLLLVLGLAYARKDKDLSRLRINLLPLQNAYA
jgi:hypothetical protein